MSFILDALRKSEEERQRGQLPDLIHRTHVRPVQDTHRRWWGAAALLIALNAGGWGVWLWRSGATVTAGPVAMPEAAVLSTPNSALPSTPDAPLPDPASSPVPTRTPAYTQVIVVPQGSTAVVKALPSHDLTAMQNTTLQQSAVAEPVTLTQAIDMPPPPAPPLPPALRQGMEPPPAEDHQYLPTLEDLPAGIRQDMLSMTFSSHMYSSLPKFRSVVVNGRKVREGELLADGTRLLEITENGAVLERGGTRFQVDVLGKWAP